MAGGVSGQTSRTGQGAWSTTKRGAGLRLPGSQVGAVAVAGEDEEIGASAAAATSRSIRPDRSSRVQGLPGARRRPPRSCSAEAAASCCRRVPGSRSNVASPVRGFRYRSCSEHVTPHVHWVTFNRWSRGQGHVDRVTRPLAAAAQIRQALGAVGRLGRSPTAPSSSVTGQQGRDAGSRVWHRGSGVVRRQAQRMAAQTRRATA